MKDLVKDECCLQTQMLLTETRKRRLRRPIRKAGTEVTEGICSLVKCQDYARNAISKILERRVAMVDETSVDLRTVHTFAAE